MDLKQIRQNAGQVMAALEKRGKYDLEPILKLDTQQRELGETRSQLQA
ncbi:MAG: serine--tRNA ligase, partial [Cyanobacteria bacterium J06659_2]